MAFSVCVRTCRPYGTRDLLPPYPALKRWAILFRARGAVIVGYAICRCRAIANRIPQNRVPPQDGTGCRGHCCAYHAAPSPPGRNWVSWPLLCVSRSTESPRTELGVVAIAVRITQHRVPQDGTGCHGHRRSHHAEPSPALRDGDKIAQHAAPGFGAECWVPRPKQVEPALAGGIRLFSPREGSASRSARVIFALDFFRGRVSNLLQAASSQLESGGFHGQDGHTSSRGASEDKVESQNYSCPSPERVAPFGASRSCGAGPRELPILESPHRNCLSQRPGCRRDALSPAVTAPGATRIYNPCPLFVTCALAACNSGRAECAPPSQFFNS